MINWENFIFFSVASIICWGIASVLSAITSKKSTIAILFALLGISIYATFIIGYWIFIDRPPLRTMGETRLWFSFFLAAAGFLIYMLWHYRFILSFTTLLSTLFIIINILKPEIHHKELMPALQSIWFIPHVVIYMISYAFLGASFLFAVYRLFNKNPYLSKATDNLVSIGTGAFTLGMFMGSLWAKEAWGVFWDWDPKETWALMTWLFYLIYLLHRKIFPNAHTRAMVLLIVAFLFLLICWFGVNYLPYPEKSLHLYN